MQQAIAGFRLVAERPVLRSLAACDVFLALGFSITGASYMIFVSRDIAFETGLLGLIFATGALGSLAGAAIAPRLGRAMGSGNALTMGLVAAGLGALLIPLVPAAGLVGVVLLIGHQIIGDSGSVVAMIHSRTLRQIHSPAAIRGRVDAALRGISQLATLGGAVAGGAVATIYGTRASLWLAAAAILVAAPLVWGLFRASGLQETPSPPG